MIVIIGVGAACFVSGMGTAYFLMLGFLALSGRGD